MKKFFEIINLQMPCAFILPDGTRFCLQTGIPNNALPVYKSGFQHLGLKQGAEELFKKDTVEEILRLISKARRAQDVEVLALAKPKSVKVQEAAAKRILFFSNQ